MNALTIVFVFALSTQQPVQTPSTVQEPPASAPAGPHSPDYRLGAGDLISIRVSGVRQFDQSTPVSNSGRIRVPYVGIMLVAGLTPLEVEREIARQIKEHELVNEPLVRVQVEQYRSQPTYVVGEVSAPGQFVITGEMYLLDLISKAGGLLPSAAETGYLYRRNSLQPDIKTRLITRTDRPESGLQPATKPPATAAAQPSEPRTEEVTAIDFKEVREGTRPDMNVKLQGGDILYVPRRKRSFIYVIGDVLGPGPYPLNPRVELTAARAVASAGGPLPQAKMSNGFLMRYNEAGERVALPVDFAAILEGRKPDVVLKPDDIIFIPSSSAKYVGQALFNMLPRLLQQLLIF
jgi:polysaccharide export outer membrane protein